MQEQRCSKWYVKIWSVLDGYFRAGTCAHLCLTPEKLECDTKVAVLRWFFLWQRSLCCCTVARPSTPSVNLHCLLNGDVLEKCVPVLKVMDNRSSYWVRAHDQVLILSLISSRYYKIAMYPFFLIFLGRISAKWFVWSRKPWDWTSCKKAVFGIKYAHDVVLLSDCAQTVQHALNQHSICFPTSKCKRLFQDRQVPVPGFSLRGDQL